ncbi:peptidoglycan editing factor PgeF [bacterium]|nr:peptidoglycan editing factor PgeF [bacterium]MBU1994230.1 peptidoglycan editing factor PgeF [bacterium]
MKKSKLLSTFSDNLHAFTVRSGGFSAPPYASLNLGFHVGDNPWHVEMNHELLANTLGYDKKALIHMKQIHSEKVHTVSAQDNFYNPPTCDALITDKRNIPLMVMVADCSPLLFYDDEKKVIAVAHAGRQGAFKNIVTNVIKSFRDDFQSDAQNICVSIGASIGRCCYEVGSEIFDEACGIGLKYAITQKEGRYYLDVSKILQTQLLACGIQKQNIEISGECTCCKNDTYFSYRAEGKTGRFAGVLVLLDKEEA